LDRPEKIEKVIKKVWASTWNYRGYLERRMFGINQSQVAMAILIQPFYKSQSLCHGVAITAHPFRADFPGFYINVQTGGRVVTDNSDGITPEQILVWNYRGEVSPVPERIAKSSLSDDWILTDEHLKHVGELLRILDKKMAKDDDPMPMQRPGFLSNRCVDVEFIVLKSNQIAILQCRPYAMTYTDSSQRD